MRLSFALVLVGLLGCGGGVRPPVIVQGKATLDGKPLQRCVVILTSEDGAVVRQASVREDGSFTAVDVPPGKYNVAVRTNAYLTSDFEYSDKGRLVMKKGDPPPVIPARYQDVKTSSLSVEVGSDPVEVALTSH